MRSREHRREDGSPQAAAREAELHPELGEEAARGSQSRDKGDRTESCRENQQIQQLFLRKDRQKQRAALTRGKKAQRRRRNRRVVPTDLTEVT